MRRSIDFMSLKVFFGAVLKVDRNGEIIEVDLPNDLFQKFKTNKEMFITTENFPFTVDTVKSEEAKKAGLQQGDKILAFNGEPVELFIPNPHFPVIPVVYPAFFNILGMV